MTAPRRAGRKAPRAEQKLCAAAHAWFYPAAAAEAQQPSRAPRGAPTADSSAAAPLGFGSPHGHGHDHVDGQPDDPAGHLEEPGHGAAHDHGPAAGPGPARDRPPLERAAGRGRTLFLDCPSGISGDMTVAALLDLGVPAAVVDEALAALPVGGYHIEHDAVHVGPLAARVFRVRVGPTQHHRRYAEIDAMLRAASLAEPVRDRARQIFARLAEAEAVVHGVPVEEVTFHEVGAVDSIVDIVATAAALAFVEGSLAVSPLPIGRGLVATQHGPLPLPAPATLLCLRGVPTYGVDLDAELVTPTGAAIVGALGEQFVRWPSFTPDRVGVGAGQRALADRPNLVRAVLGTPTVPQRDEKASGAHVVIEANVDDLTGELAGHAIEALLAAGALDAWLTPVTMKKGRPGLIIGVVARESELDKLAAVLLAQTSTIGVRHHRVERIEQHRQSIVVPTRFGPLPVKVSTGAGAPDHVKPEFDACRAAALEHGVAVREVLAEVLASYRGELRR